MKECPHCGYKKNTNDAEVYANYYGRICVNCNNFIEPDIQPQFIADNKNKQQFIRETLKQFLKKKVVEGKLNINGEKDANK